jgi:hypothetical protein
MTNPVAAPVPSGVANKLLDGKLLRYFTSKSGIGRKTAI